MVIMMLLLTGWPWAAFTQEDEAFLQEAGDMTQERRETLSQATGSLPPSAKNLPEENDGSLPQETEILREEAGIKVNVSMDLVSSYIWRGVRQGNGPALQPTLEINVGRFTLGAWGSYYFADENHSEADLYATLSLGDFTLGVGTITIRGRPGGTLTIMPLSSMAAGHPEGFPWKPITS